MLDLCENGNRQYKTETFQEIMINPSFFCSNNNSLFLSLVNVTHIHIDQNNTVALFSHLIKIDYAL
jgi:hypothetical protein